MVTSMKRVNCFDNPNWLPRLHDCRDPVRRSFIRGQTAKLIVADMKRHNGLITMADMHAYVAKEREPLRGTYRGYEVLSMPPPSSGGAVLLEMLNILEGYDLSEIRLGFI